jgi:hypothetical protein
VQGGLENRAACGVHHSIRSVAAPCPECATPGGFSDSSRRACSWAQAGADHDQRGHHTNTAATTTPHPITHPITHLTTPRPPHPHARHTPTGTPPLHKEPWTADVEWARGNALEPRTYERLLPGALAAISCVGGFGSQSEMARVNGAANAAAIAAAKAAGIPRFVYLSAHTPNVPGIDLLLSGYIQVCGFTEWACGRNAPGVWVWGSGSGTVIPGACQYAGWFYSLTCRQCKRSA